MNHNKENFDYKIQVLILNLFNISLANKKSDNLTNSFLNFSENLLEDLINFKIENKLIHKDLEKDEILLLNNVIARLVNILNSKSENEENKKKILSSLNKLFTLYYDNVLFIPLILEKYIVNNSNLLSFLRNNLISYYNSFGFLPNGLDEVKIIDLYNLSTREKYNLPFKKEDLKRNSEEFQLIYFLLKSYNLVELQADLLSLLEKKDKANKNFEDLIKFYFSDFIINNKLEKNNTYYQAIDQIYATKINPSEKDFSNHLLFSTIAYLKDGNLNFATNNLFDLINKRLEFIKNNDKELINLINNINSVTTLNKGYNESNQTFINLDSDYLPFIDQIKTLLSELLNYETTFKTNNNILLAKENILDKLFEKRILKDSEKSSDLFREEDVYYNEKLNNIVFNIEQIKILSKKKESEKSSKLSSRPKNILSNPLEEIKIYIYSKLDDSHKCFYDISRVLFMDIHRFEDLENIKFQNNNSKQQIVRSIERKIREFPTHKNLNYETKQQIKFYKNLMDYFESKPISLSTDVILSEDMLNYIQNPNIILENKVDDQNYFSQARNYFSEYYKKLTKKNTKLNVFVLENLDFLKNNLKIDLENILISNGVSYYNNNLSYENPDNLKIKIEHYEKTLNFLKDILNKIPEFNKTETIKDSEKKENLLKKFINFESENLLKYENNKADLISVNKPNHLIENYLKSYTNQINKKFSLYLESNIPRNTNKYVTKNRNYPFKNLNQKNLFRFLITNNLEKQDVNIMNILAERLIVPKINSNRVAVYKNLLSQIQSLNQIIKGKSLEKDFAVNDLYKSLFTEVNIQFNKSEEDSESLSGSEVNSKQKLKEMKNIVDQNFEVFKLSNCIYMILFGVENNIPEGKENFIN